MRASTLSYLMLRKKKEEQAYHRPRFIKRLEDAKVFFRQSNGTYQAEDGQYLKLTVSLRVLAGKEPGYEVSKEEAPNFHDVDNKAFLLGGVSK